MAKGLGGNRGAGAVVADLADAKTGVPLEVRVFRGVGAAPADPGDAGVGRYYSSSSTVAGSYGDRETASGVLRSPYVFETENQLSRAVSRFRALRGTLEQRKAASQRMTDFYKSKGHDGLVYPGWDGPGTFSVVVFP